MISGIILMVMGLIVFSIGVVRTRENPGLEKQHLALMLVGGIVLLVGALMAYGKFFEYMG